MLVQLAELPLLVLFLVAGIGFAIGRIKVRGASLGVAAVLFVGLAFGALNPGLQLPAVIFEFGLVLFVYSVGLSSGPSFFASLNRQGLRDNLLVISVLLVAGVIAAAAKLLLSLDSPVAAGLYAGSLTNTPALGNLVEVIRLSAPAELVDSLANQPVVGYSVAYPVGVLGVILAILVMRRIYGIDYRADAQRLRGLFLVEQELYATTVRVNKPDVTWATIEQLSRAYEWNVVLGRVQRGDQVFLARGDLKLQMGDLVSLVGDPEDVHAVMVQMGEPSDQHLEFDRGQYDFRRVFLSNPELAGQRLSELNLLEQYGAVVTRVRRGDVDLLAQGDTVLELGDRVRVLTKREDMKQVSELFGDSYKSLSEVNLLSLGLGLVLGMLLGLIVIPLPGGASFRIGNAIGPLAAGLVLGKVRRTGPVVWTLPYSANLTLRQLGLVFLLASIGLRSGYTFFNTLLSRDGMVLFVAGAIITFTTSFLILWIGYTIFKTPFTLLIGMLAGVHTQPAVLGFVQDQTGSELPNSGYALTFPMATVTKIVVAQLILVLVT